MSTRTNLRPTVVIDEGSMAGDITSDVTVLQSITGISYAVSWTGTSPVGDLSVEVSNDFSLFPDGTVNNPGSWNTIYLNVNGSPAASISISGNTGTAFIDIEKTMAYAVRLIYTRVSGTGTMMGTVMGKVS